MNKLLTGIVLLCFSIGAIAQEKEIWACQPEAGTLLSREDGGWKPYGRYPKNILVTIDGANSSYKEGEDEYALSCSKVEYFPNVSCLDFTMSTHLFFNSNSGKMGMSSLYGATSTGDSTYTVSAQVFNCTKF